jgi:hypothetical protein
MKRRSFMCMVCQIVITVAATLAGLMPAMAVAEATPLVAPSHHLVPESPNKLELSLVSLGVDGLDAKGCVSPGQKVTASGSGFDAASSTPKVFITPGLFGFGVYPETKETIAVDATVTSSSRLSFVVPAASRFGKSSINGMDLTVLFKWPGYFADIAFLVCGKGASGSGSQSGKTSPSGKASATTVARSSGSGKSLLGKRCAPVGQELNVNGMTITCKKSGGSSRWVEAGK